MDLSVSDIKKLAKSIKKDRKWLADHLAVSIHTVNNWLAPPTYTNTKSEACVYTEFDDPSSQTIKTKKVNYDDIITFSVRLTPEEWNALLPPDIDQNDYAAAESISATFFNPSWILPPPMPRPKSQTTTHDRF